MAFQPADDVGVGGSHGFDDGEVRVALVFDAGEEIVGDGLQALGASEQPLRFGELVDEQPLVDVARPVIGAEVFEKLIELFQ